MRSRFARLTGLAAGIALIATPVLTAGPASADEIHPNVHITVVDDLGKPVTAAVALVFPDSDGGEGGGGPYFLSGTDSDSDPDYLDSSFSVAVPPGEYAIVALGGWPGMTCVGTTTCGLGVSGFSEYMEAPEFKSAAITVPEDGSVNYTVTTATPKFTGTAVVGNDLEVTAPDSTGGGGLFLPDALELLVGDLTSPTMVWKRNGTKVEGEGEDDLTYALTGADVGKAVSATVTYPIYVSQMLSTYLYQFADTDDDVLSIPAPEPVTFTSAVVAKRASTVDVRVVGKQKKNKPARAWVTVGGGDDIRGWVQVKVKGKAPIRVRANDGFAQVRLQHVKAGKHKVTAKFLGTKEFNPSKDSAKFTVKGKKHNKR